MIDGARLRRIREAVGEPNPSDAAQSDDDQDLRCVPGAEMPPPGDAAGEPPHAATAPPPLRPVDIDERRLTEIGNARRFAARHGHCLRYVHAWARWLTWDGRRWCRDGLGAEMRAAKAIADSLFADAAALMVRAAAGEAKAAELAEAVSKFARVSSKASSCRAMLQLAQSEDPIAASETEFDRDRFVLNLLNGTLDLRDGRLRTHRQKDMITRLAPVAWDADATCPRWTQFLERVMPDADVRRFVQRFIGYCLTGDVSEQILMFAYGLGANGKSVLLDVVLAMLGDYGRRAAPDLVLSKQGEAHPTEIADLEGRRFVVCSEIEQGRAWSESLIKRITGDTTITARHMREDFYTFEATHKLLIAANTRPAMRGTDNGIWRRMRLVPFGVTILPEEQDRKLVDKLIATELSGILRWAVEGCREWQQHGIGAPQAVVEATADYRKEQDVLGLWIADECVIGSPELFASTTNLHASFTAWCTRTGRHPWQRETMRERLLERPGIAAKNTNTSRGMTGIGLLDVRHAPDPRDPS